MVIELRDTDVIWRNARLATMDPSINTAYGLLKEHDLLVRNGKILAILPTATLQTSCCQVMDVQQRLITPGLIDCHTHLVFGGNRAYEWEQRLNGMSYAELSAQGGGINATVSATRTSSLEQLEHSAQQRLAAFMAEGVTTIEIKSGYGLNLENEEKLLQVAQNLAQHNPIEISSTLLAAHTCPPEYKHNPDAYINLICEVILPQLWKKKLFEAVDVFCESVGFNLTQTERLFQEAERWNIPVKGHVEQLSNLGGSELVARYHGLSVDHIEYLDQAGVEALSRSGTVAVLLPGAFYFLQETQRPPVDLLRRFNVPIAISTDFNPGTSPFASLRMAMNMACVQFGLTPEEAWLGVTRHAARALGREKSHGQLRAGAYADFIVWDAENPVDIFYEFGHNQLNTRVFRGTITHSNTQQIRNSK
ncbi:imidazolonepropionase [Photorhabdus sp. SF281]|uniref:imidazolonepropionase n=1 Tax=Photorhabdus sp. SF281 TaxID=3459527 RepID=UPI00404424E5